MLFVSKSWAARLQIVKVKLVEVVQVLRAVVAADDEHPVLVPAGGAWSVYIYIYIYICIYVYIETRERERDTYIYIYIYIICARSLAKLVGGVQGCGVSGCGVSDY